MIEEFKKEEKLRRSLVNTLSTKSSTTDLILNENTNLKEEKQEDEQKKEQQQQPLESDQLAKDEFKVKDYLEHMDECVHLKPEKIIGATEIDKSLVFLLKFENSKQIYLIQSKIANVKYPQTVIQFYEEHYTFID